MTEATADALAEPVTEQSPEETENAELNEIYERLNNPGTDDASDEPDEVSDDTPEDDDAPETAADDAEDPDNDEPDEAPAEEIKVPSDLPQSLRERWKDIPPEAREAIHKDRSDLNRRLSDAGRQIQGIAPIRDVLTEAVQQFPSMADMKPAEAARQIFQLAKVSQEFNQDPVGAMMGLIKDHNMGEAVFAALQGQPAAQSAQGTVAMQQKIADLERKLTRATDPDFMREQVTSVTAQERTMSELQEFASSQEKWAEVEEHIPTTIPLAQRKLGEGAANKAVLELAYKMALETFLPDAVKSEDAAEKAATPDPKAAARAIKAKSVNVKARSSGSPRKMTEDELLRDIYDRAMKQ